MINTKKIILGLLASSLSFTAFPMEQEATAPTEKQTLKIQTIDYLMKKLGHIRKCLQGKETCSKADFAILGTTLLALYGFIHRVALSIELLPTELYTPGLLHHPITKSITAPEQAGRRVGEVVAYPLDRMRRKLIRKRRRK